MIGNAEYRARRELKRDRVTTVRRGRVAGCLAAAVASIAIVAPAAFAASTPTAKRWAPAFMTNKNSFTHDEAIATAQRFDLIVVQPFALSAAFVNDMHTANPMVKILAYVNGTFTKVTNYPEAYYAHDLLGSRISWIPFGLTLLEMSNPDTRAAVGGLATAALAKAPFDGVLLDNLGLTVLNTSDKTGYPIVPLAGLQLLPPAVPLLPYLGAAWLNNNVKLLTEVRNAHPQAFVMGNGLGRGVTYYDLLAPTSVLSNSARAMESEQFVRAAGDDVATYRTEAAWKSDIDMIVDSEQRGAPVTAVTKLWVTATAKQREAWHRYAFGTFLLGTDGSSWFSYLGDKLLDTSVSAGTIENVDIGTASGGYAKVNGVYQRPYTKALVLVNPATTAVTVPLVGTFTNLDGVVVTKSIVMKPHTGEVLTSS